jgi:hypothetical protein
VEFLPDSESGDIAEFEFKPLMQSLTRRAPEVISTACGAPNGRQREPTPEPTIDFDLSPTSNSSRRAIDRNRHIFSTTLPAGSTTGGTQRARSISMR